MRVNSPLRRHPGPLGGLQRRSRGMRILAAAGLLAVAGAFKCTGRATFTDPSMPIEMRRGAEFDIALKSNHSTGYQWVLVDSAAIAPLRHVKTGYGVPRRNRNRNGAGGTETWTFAAPGPGQTTLDFVYKRPWENRPPADSVRFRVRVR
jgi:predicted secreted protein